MYYVRCALQTELILMIPLSLILRQNAKDQLYRMCVWPSFLLPVGWTDEHCYYSLFTVQIKSENIIVFRTETTSLILTMALRRPPTRVELKADDIEEYHEVSTRF